MPEIKENLERSTDGGGSGLKFFKIIYFNMEPTTSLGDLLRFFGSHALNYINSCSHRAGTRGLMSTIYTSL